MSAIIVSDWEQSSIRRVCWKRPNWAIPGGALMKGWTRWSGFRNSFCN